MQPAQGSVGGGGGGGGGGFFAIAGAAASEAASRIEAAKVPRTLFLPFGMFILPRLAGPRARLARTIGPVSR